MNTATASVLFGRDRHRTRRSLILAAVIFVASLALYTSFPVYETLPLAYLVIAPSMPIIAGTVALISAYLNDGLLVSALMPVMAVLGMELSLGIWLYFNMFPAYDPSGFGFIPILLVAAFVIGGVLAVTGASTRRVVTSITS